MPVSSGATGGVQATGLIGTGHVRRYTRSTTTTSIVARRIVRFISPQTGGQRPPLNEPLLTRGLLTLSFAAGVLHLAFDFDRQFGNSGFAHRLDPAQCFIQNAPLMLRPAGLAGNAAELTFVKSRSRRSRPVQYVALDGQHHRGNSRALERARGQRN